ncbi:hypothetical protein NC651_026091 [Populus alba x Populus x berolinensis]|nr:hypothetical protein NC651_026091 [Populus alba x Populus x berolinensis]
MEVIDCPKIVSLPEESLAGLSSLRSLSIENCHGLASQPSRMQHATALERLTIMYCSNLEAGSTASPETTKLPSYETATISDACLKLWRGPNHIVIRPNVQRRSTWAKLIMFFLKRYPLKSHLAYTSIDKRRRSSSLQGAFPGP